MTCQRVVLPDGGVAIVCGVPSPRTICDVCDKPVRKNGPGYQAFTFRGRKIDLCPNCLDDRARGDPEWRRFAEAAIIHNPQLEPAPP